MKLVAEHVVSGRGLVRWSQADLAKAAGVSPRTVARFEAKQPPPLGEESLFRIQSALEKMGVEFLNSGSPGVRLRPEKVQRTE